MKKIVSILVLTLFVSNFIQADNKITIGNCQATLQGDTVYVISRDFNINKVGRRAQVIISSQLQIGGYTFAENARYFQGKGFQSKYKRFYKNSVTLSAEGDYQSQFTLTPEVVGNAERALLITQIEEESCCRVNVHYDSCWVILPQKPVVLEAAPTLITLSVAEKLQPVHQLLHPMNEYQPFAENVPIHRDKDALKVYFPLDKSQLDYSYKQNRETLDTIAKIVRDIYNDTRSDVQIIQIVGFASVEGSLKHNQELAGNRAKVLKDYIQEVVHQPDSIFEVANGGEAWLQLRDAIVELDEPWKEDVLNIIDGESDLDKREQKLKAYKKGVPFAHIKKFLLENQRNSGYIRVYFNAKPDLPGKAVNEAVKQINEGNADYEAIYNAIIPFADDERTYNILGVACYMTKRTDEAIKYFQKAADLGDKQAKINLDRINQTGK